MPRWMALKCSSAHAPIALDPRKPLSTIVSIPLNKHSKVELPFHILWMLRSLILGVRILCTKFLSHLPSFLHQNKENEVHYLDTQVVSAGCPLSYDHPTSRAYITLVPTRVLRGISPSRDRTHQVPITQETIPARAAIIKYVMLYSLQITQSIYPRISG